MNVAMRSGTVTAWLFVGWGLMTIGAIGIFVSMAGLIEGGRWPEFLAAMGFVYFIIGGVLAGMHDRHMIRRWRARNQ